MRPNFRLWYILLVSVFISFSANAQDYFLKNLAPFDTKIPSPESFLGYEIGERHTRHDQIVAYFSKLAEISNRASITVYGKTHEHRKLVLLTVSSPSNVENLDQIKQQHLALINPNKKATNYNEVPVFVQLGYSVHGNEPSSSEAAMLTAYSLVASNNKEVLNYLDNAVIFIDPTLNPDGRDRHTQWANQFRANQLVSDGVDAEHNEAWPRGRTNHYWFDLNRDWLLGVHPESQGKLKWHHEWYPNVVTDFHEMGTNSSYFFEPMKPIGSLDPIMPKENYKDLNNAFAPYYVRALDSIGSFYYTKESFDGTYPGYGSSYPDLQGGLAILFEQASSRGHIQETSYGKITFPFTIRNQFISSMATIKAAVGNKTTLRKYQQEFFITAVKEMPKTGFTAYEFGDSYDKNRTKAFIEKLQLHAIDVYKKGEKFVVPLKQPQRRMVQTMFETYSKYRDSVFYDASAWSMALFYNMPFKGIKTSDFGKQVLSSETLFSNSKVSKSDYAYILDWDDYLTPAALYYMQSKGIVLASAFKPFTLSTSEGIRDFNYGSLMIPVSKQKKSSKEVFEIVKAAQGKFDIPVFAVNSGFSLKGIDLGSNNFRALKQPKVALLIGDGVSSLEAGEVWHLLDTRIPMPVTKIQMRSFGTSNLDKYNALVMVSGSYTQLDSLQRSRIAQWTAKGNTLITIAGASKWVIDKKMVKEALIVIKKDDKEVKEVKRLPYVDAPENRGKERIGGVILKVDLDRTHPIGFGYRSASIPVYKNNQVYLKPSKSPYATVGKYNKDPHIDGFVSNKNLNNFIKPAASILVSAVKKGRVIMFADNPNFRGAWYGTNRLFLNALFLGNHISVPKESN